MHGLQACLLKYITIAAFHIYAQRVKMPIKERLEAMHYIVMEITLLIMESRGKIMELYFWISVGTLQHAITIVFCSRFIPVSKNQCYSMEAPKRRQNSGSENLRKEALNFTQRSWEHLCNTMLWLTGP